MLSDAGDYSYPFKRDRVPVAKLTGKLALLEDFSIAQVNHHQQQQNGDTQIQHDSITLRLFFRTAVVKASNETDSKL